jgi:hypothetical protein
MLAVNQVLGTDSHAVNTAAGINVEITRYSLSLLNREMFSFSITRTMDRDYESGK